MRKTLNIITIVLDVILILILGAVKINHYIEADYVDFSDFDIYRLLFLIWIPISMAITISPMLTQIGMLVFVKKGKQVLACLLPVWCLVGDGVFEVISLIGGTMTLSEEWLDTSLTIIKLLLLFIVPMILSVITLIMEKSENKKKAQA